MGFGSMYFYSFQLYKQVFSVWKKKRQKKKKKRTFNVKVFVFMICFFFYIYLSVSFLLFLLFIYKRTFLLFFLFIHKKHELRRVDLYSLMFYICRQKCLCSVSSKAR